MTQRRSDTDTQTANIDVAAFDRRLVDQTPFDEVLQDFERTLVLLDDAGVELPASSRFVVYRNMLKSFVFVGSKRDEPRIDLDVLRPHLDRIDIPVLHRGLLEIDELMHIAHELPRAFPESEWVPRVREILGGQPMAPGDAHHTVRDKQFELYLAAVCLRASCEVELCEPDLVVRTPIATFGIAAKRPSSPRRIQRRIHRAADQIRRSRLNGIIAIDLSLLENPQDRAISYPHKDSLLPPIEAHVERWMQRNIGRYLQTSKPPPNAVGVMVRLNVLAVGAGHQLGRGTRVQVTNLCSLDDPQVPLLRDFTDRITKAMAGPRSTSAIHESPASFRS